jgi:hypothetical protein
MHRTIGADNKEAMDWLNATKTFGVPQATQWRTSCVMGRQIQGTQKGLG